MVFEDTSQDEHTAQRSMRFSLTPLADAMFQLLVFFMLSAGLSPYSGLLLQSGPSQDIAATTNPDAEAGEITAGDGSAVTWTLRADTISVPGNNYEYDQLDLLMEILQRDGIERVVIVATPEALVQGLTLVMEALTASNVTDIQLVRSLQ